MKKLTTLLATAPSWVWVILFPLGIIAFIGTIIGLFYLLANVEGFASIIFILIGWGMGSAFAPKPHQKKHDQLPSFMIGGFICFYALMGMAIDQPGNYFFNKPIEWWLCPADTNLNRTVDVSHPLPGRTDLTQDFQCRNSQGQIMARASLGGVVGIRFLEYVLVAYLFMGLKQLQYRLTQTKSLGTH
jgi:hypothetical protein